MENKEPIPVAVIGVGHLGSRHARVYASLPEARLVGVVDINAGRAREVADSHGTEAFADFHDLLPRIRAASVAVPTVDHHRVVVELMEAGVDVLVEKPIAEALSDGAAMVNTATRRGCVLAVGHTERYNPAVEAVLDHSREPRFIEVHRLGTFTARSLDIDAVLDLMIHDLDIVGSLVRSEVTSVDAVGVAVLTDRVDIANARLRFANGCVTNLTASRISQEKVRKLRVWEREQYISVDYLNQEALRYTLQGAEPLQRVVQERLPVEPQEPLRLELADFLRAVASGVRPRVSGEDGLRALALAKRVISAMGVSGEATPGLGRP